MMALAEARAANLARQRFIASVSRLCRLGPRAVFEALDELARRGDRQLVEGIVSGVSSIDPDLLRAVSGDRFPAGLPRVVGGRGA